MSGNLQISTSTLHPSELHQEPAPVSDTSSASINTLSAGDGRLLVLPGTDAVMGSLWGRIIKRAMDIALAIPIVILVLPGLCLLVKAAQLLQSRGPLFYFQKRCGRFGQEFTILKFRTMNQPPVGQTDIETDPGKRIYPLGSFLRRSKLDEIPQFVNVLFGTMSVVGPRPHHSKDCVDFSEQVSDYTGRFVAKPGITGLAQYKEYRGDFEWNCVENRVAKDLLYIREWSPLLDLLLIVKTVNVVSRRIISGALRRIGIGRSAVPRTTAPLSVHAPNTESDSPNPDDNPDEKQAA